VFQIEIDIDPLFIAHLLDFICSVVHNDTLIWLHSSNNVLVIVDSDSFLSV